MTHKIRAILIDLIAIILSISLIQYMFIFISFDGKYNLSKIIFDSVVGILLFLVSLLLFANLVKPNNRPLAVGTAFLGSFLWILYKFVSGVVADSGYLSNHPSDFYSRHIEGSKIIFAILLPIFTIITLVFIVVVRFISHRLVKLQRYE